MTGDSWHQLSLFCHDSVDSGVSKGAYVGITGSYLVGMALHKVEMV